VRRRLARLGSAHGATELARLPPSPPPRRHGDTPKHGRLSRADEAWAGRPGGVNDPSRGEKGHPEDMDAKKPTIIDLSENAVTVLKERYLKKNDKGEPIVESI
jgi:hypothetical protein